MNELNRIMPDQIGGCEVTKECASPSILDNLKRTKLAYEEKLKRVDEAIAGLEEHPEVNKVLELIARAR